MGDKGGQDLAKLKQNLDEMERIKEDNKRLKEKLAIFAGGSLN
jgi:cell shape-determining protein MreC